MDEGVQDIQAEAKIGLSALLKTRKLFIPRFDKTEKNDKNAEARYTAGHGARFRSNSVMNPKGGTETGFLAHGETKHKKQDKIGSHSEQ